MNKILTIYDVLTGRVLRHVSVPGYVGVPATTEGTAFIDGHLDPQTHRVDVDTRAPVALKEGELQRVIAADADKTARAALDELDRQSIRALRELLAPQSPVLAGMEAQAAELRADLIQTADESAKADRLAKGSASDPTS